ncbi:MAG: RDD family protein [bacterium]
MSARTRTPDLRSLSTPEGIELTVRLASVGARAAAFVLDWLIIIAITVLLAGLVVLAGASGSFSAFFILGIFLLRVFYFPLCELALQGSTPGKRSQKIRVIDSRGGPLSPRAVFARNLTREVEVFLPLVAVFSPQSIWPGAGGLVGLFAALWCVVLLLLPLANRDRLRVGDLIAGTWVVTIPEHHLLEDLSARAQRDPPRYSFTAEQLGHYGNYELHVLEDLLRNEGEVDRETWQVVCTKIKQRIGWPKDAWEVEPLPFLRAFYAAQRARLERGLLFGVRHADKNEAREAQKGRQDRS